MTNSTHGLRNHPLYTIHAAMKQRCYSTDSKYYKYYGARGITICDRWKNSFDGLRNFIEDMFPTWEKGLELDRIDVNGNYEPKNCRWSTRSQNLKNRRNRSEIQSQVEFVNYNKRSKKWYVTIPFDSKEEAEQFANESSRG
jgi:hypothetical protein